MNTYSLSIVSLIAMITISCSLSKPVTVAISTNVRSESIVGSSEINTFQLFLARNPKSKIKLEVINDQWDAETGRTLIKEATKTIPFIITSHPSSVAVNMIDLFRDGKSLCLVTASTTDKISNIDDYIFRVVPDAAEEQRSVAKKVVSIPGNRIAVIQDDGNLAYTDPAYNAFARYTYENSEKTIRVLKTNVSLFDTNAFDEFLKEPYDILYLLAGSYQSVIGNIAQYALKYNADAPIIITPWARTPALVEKAGPALQKMYLPSQYESRFKSPAIQSFLRDFKAMFGYSPISMSIVVYQCLELLNAAFEEGLRTPEEVKRYLLKIEKFESLFGTISFNEYGDLVHDFFFITDLERELSSDE